VWYAIDGNLIYAFSKDVQFSPELDVYYQVLESRVLLNGEPCQLVLAMTGDRISNTDGYGHHLENVKYEILHARLITDENDEAEEDAPRLASKVTRLLMPGDVIEPQFPTYTFPGDGSYIGPVWTPFGKITVTENTALDLELLGDGAYQISFIMIDYAGGAHSSEIGWYLIAGDDIYPAMMS